MWLLLVFGSAATGRSIYLLFYIHNCSLCLIDVLACKRFNNCCLFLAGFKCIESVDFTFASATTAVAVALPEQGAICISFS